MPDDDHEWRSRLRSDALPEHGNHLIPSHPLAVPFTRVSVAVPNATPAASVSRPPAGDEQGYRISQLKPVRRTTDHKLAQEELVA